MTDEKRKRNRLRCAGTACLAVAVLWIFLSLCFDFTYALNDDTALKDILSGAYTGAPESHNIQMLYPLSFGISLFYRLIPGVPWYGVFLCAMQFGAIYVIAASVLRCLPERLDNESQSGRASFADRKELLLSFVVVLSFLMIFSWELVFIQYTVTSGFLMTASVVRFFTVSSDTHSFFRQHMMELLLVLCAFMLRTEMALFLLPFFALTVLFRWMEENRFFERRNVINYVGVFVILAGGMTAALAVDRIAYGSEEWRTFRQFFDDRTSVYDFYGIPDYQENRQFYESIQIDETQYELLVSYNFELDPSIDAEVMRQIADYAASHQEESFGRRLYLSVYEYIYRFTHGQELCLDIMVVFGYFLLARIAAESRRRELFGKLFLLFSLRTALWLFILYRGRTPERITHPLYLMEIAVLALLFRCGALAERKRFQRNATYVLLGLLVLCCGTILMKKTVSEAERREEINTQWQEVKAYCSRNPDVFYYFDVYSTVAYSEKLFSDTDASYRNFDLLGGWVSKSPLAEQKRAYMGLGTAGQSLLAGQAHFVTDGSRPQSDVGQIVSYFEAENRKTEPEIAGKSGSFTDYRIKALMK